jgi:hypothetical protein
MNFFPNISDKFIIVGASEVSLYELTHREIEAGYIYTPKIQTLSKKQILSLSAYIFTRHFISFLDNVRFISQHGNKINFLSSEKRYQYIKCAIPSFHDQELIVACGQSSGKVSLVDFNPSSENYLEFSKLF